MTLVKLLVGFVALEHLLILWIEMFAWNTMGKKVFKSLPKALFSQTKVMAANQGLYNGFLAAGLIWSILIQDPTWSVYTAVFFLCCVVVAGMYGAMTAGRAIFFKQSFPAMITLAVLIILNY